MCEASGTKFWSRLASQRWQTRGSLGRVSESESSYVRPVKIDWRKGLLRQNQKGAGIGPYGTATYGDTQHIPRARDGTHPQTFESSLYQQVKPHVFPPGNPNASAGDETGGKGCRSKRMPCCNSEDRVTIVEVPKPKGC